MAKRPLTPILNGRGDYTEEELRGGERLLDGLLERSAGGEFSSSVTIPAPNFQTALFVIEGNAPYVQNKFSEKAKQQMKEAQEAGSVGRSKKKNREGKDFEEHYRGAMHLSSEGWHGIPTPSFRNAMISACRVVQFKMTIAKLSVFIVPDGFDKDDGTPLVRIIQGLPHAHESLVRLATGVADIRIRPMWEPGWRAKVRVRFDGDQFSAQDVANLMMRVGEQVGVGEGRPDSKNSAGMGWGTFIIVPHED